MDVLHNELSRAGLENLCIWGAGMCGLFYTLASSTEPRCRRAGVRLSEAERRRYVGAQIEDFTIDLTGRGAIKEM